MNTILERFVEDELYNAPIRAYFNGFTAFDAQSCGRQVQTMRQVQLEPYGIADIINIVHGDQECRNVTIQVVECKRDIINLATYAQVKRYLAALRQALAPFVGEAEQLGFKVTWECILVGHRVEKCGDFVFVLNDDADCHVFTYQVDAQEIIFAKVGKNWGYHRNEQHLAHAKLSRAVIAEAEAAFWRASAEYDEFYSKYDKSGCPL